MSRRRKGRSVHGILLLDKPAGYSSNQAVQKVRWLYQARKAGHTGSLDPFATGMLPVCFGEASKTAGFMLDASKKYLASARFGQATATGDVEGEIISELPCRISPQRILNAHSRVFAARSNRFRRCTPPSSSKGSHCTSWRAKGKKSSANRAA